MNGAGKAMGNAFYFLFFLILGLELDMKLLIL